MLARHCLLFAVLIVCVYTDLAYGKLHNWCTLPAIFAGLLINYVFGGLRDGGWLGTNLAGSALAVGIVLGLARHRTGSVFPVILIHFVNNVVASAEMLWVAHT